MREKTMPSQSTNPRLASFLKRGSQIAAAVTALGGISVLIGWALEIPILKSVLPGLVTMKANTALGFLLAGLSLGLKGRAGRNQQRLARGCAVLVALIGGLTLSQYMFGLDFGIDQLLFPESTGAVGTSSPGRMAPTTALNFLLLGIGLLLLDQARGVRITQWGALTAGVIGLLNCLGYLYGVEALYGFASYTKMAVHTAAAFLILAFGLLCTHPDQGMVGVITADAVGGKTARRLLPILIGVPILLGWLCLQGQRAGLYGTEFGLAMMALASILIFGVVIWWNAWVLNRTDARRQLLEERLKEANQAIKHHAQQLESANGELEAFSYSVSHDLRAPLRAVDGFSKILEEEYAATLGDEGRRVLGVIRHNIQRMGQLIDDLLAFAHLGRQELQRSHVDVESLVHEVYQELLQTNPERSMDLHLQTLPTIRADRVMLRQVFVNLLSNAIKFTRTKPAAVIEVGARPEDHQVIYYVKDNGVGFDMTYASKLFGVFQRLHRQEEFEGTGVGLAIVQRVVARHGGRVWAEGKVNEGAAVYVALPSEGGVS